MALYVSAVEGHLAPRYGSHRSTPGEKVKHEQKVDKRGKTRTLTLRQPGTVHGPEFFGLTRTLDGSGGWDLSWDTERVFLISDAEEARHGHEFRQLLAVGALRARTKAEWDAWHAKQAEAEKAHDAKQKAAQASAPATPPSAA